MELACLLGRHDWGTWELRPPVIGQHVPWLYYERRCQRKGCATRPTSTTPAAERRWFRVRQGSRIPITRTMRVEQYLALIHMKAPGPDAPGLVERLDPPKS